jgi:hypothetical protein
VTASNCKIFARPFSGTTSPTVQEAALVCGKQNNKQNNDLNKNIFIP